MKKTIKFRANNKITFGQDMAFWSGIPSGVDFEVKEGERYFILVADGFGSFRPGESYGNGKIYVSKGLLTSAQRKRFKSVATKAT